MQLIGWYESSNTLGSRRQFFFDALEHYDVNFALMIIPSICDKEQPCIGFNKEVIEFCYLTGTTIQGDVYIHSTGEEKER